ncbi:AVB_G0031610.mRNA.1.CDS.1 [Saccharomyces cerevisiae]|nr:AVB_G0031610.mRNA.1.CDS.1 [Saccharomyces cerevisiae]CAI7193557.1 AVB_G0031610.mRNA.1.CDS.1 [Saccharomyces cerevisiae]
MRKGPFLYVGNGKVPTYHWCRVNHLKASSYSIYSQASVIAINQDPKGVFPATRVWRYYVSDTDEDPQGEIQMWSGPLDNGDQVVALLNVRKRSKTNEHRPWKRFSLTAIWVQRELTSTWDIYDLWANRVDNSSRRLLSLNRIRQPPVFSTMLQSSLIKTVCLRMIQDCLARKLVVFLQMLYLTQLFQLMVSPSIG